MLSGLSFYLTLHTKWVGNKLMTKDGWEVIQISERMTTFAIKKKYNYTLEVIRNDFPLRLTLKKEGLVIEDRYIETEPQYKKFILKKII